MQKVTKSDDSNTRDIYEIQSLHVSSNAVPAVESDDPPNNQIVGEVN
jgi:hypothetical protein